MPGVVVNFRNAGFGGSSHPNNSLSSFDIKVAITMEVPPNMDHYISPEKWIITKRDHGFDYPENRTIMA